MTTMNIPDFAGTSTAVEKPNTNGRAAAANGRPVTLSNEDLAALTALATAFVAANASLDNIEAAAVDTTTPSPVKIDQTTPGTTNGVSVAEIGSTAVTTGNGVVGAGTQRVAIASDNTPFNIKIDQTTPGTTNAVSVQTPADVISFTPTLDTAAYASGDVLFATAAISGVTRANDLRALLTSLTVIDKSKQNPAFTLLFYQTNVTSAAANAANALSDADQINCLGFVNIAAADYLTFANNSVLCYSGNKAPNLLLEAATGTTTVYVVGILQAGTPTFAVGDLVMKLGIVQS